MKYRIETTFWEDECDTCGWIEGGSETLIDPDGRIIFENKWDYHMGGGNPMDFDMVKEIIEAMGHEVEVINVAEE